MRIDDVQVTLVEVPQVAPIAPYRSHLRESSTTQSGIVRVRTADGLTGWGEYNVNFLPDLSARRATQQAREWLVGRESLSLDTFAADCPLETRLKSGVEIALWDIMGKAAGQPVAQLLGSSLRDSIELAACMGIQTYERAYEIALQYAEAGFSTIKIKAGRAIAEDIAMVRAIRDAVGNRLKIRVDPNCAYSREDALELSRQCEEFELEYLEQPLGRTDLEGASWLRRQTRTPIALNESVVGPESVAEILAAHAADAILPDTHIAGGMLPCMQIGTLCEAAGLPCVMHCGHDLGPKTAAMLHVAAASPAYTLANDSTYYGLEDDICRERFAIINGRIAVPTSPGLGIDIDEAKLRRYAVAIC